MEKIKRLDEVILPESRMLVEIKRPKRSLILPDGSEDKDSYAVILAKHSSVKDLEIGDIIVKVSNFLTGYMVGDKQYGIVYRGNVFVAVKPNNFIEPDKITEKVNI